MTRTTTLSTAQFDGDFDRCISNLAEDVRFARAAFYGRKELREAAGRWYLDCEGVPTLQGARIRPMAHQIHAALKVLRDRTQRFLLADEVGLGKTIEAGLIVQALFHHRPEMSVLVVAPGSMVFQWQRELYLRFGARAFAILDGTANEAERRRVLETGRVIVSMTALLRHPLLRAELQRVRWETLVVDEAHHLDAHHPLYGWTREISRIADHALVLSATPSKREAAGLGALLALVAPDDFDPEDAAGLKKRIAARDEIWATVDRIGQLLKAAFADEQARNDKEVVKILVDEFGSSFAEDARISAWLREAVDTAQENVDDALRLVARTLAYAQERWRIDHRIIRTRRKTLEFLEERFARRELGGEVAYEPSAGELAVASLLRELPAPEGECEATWYGVLDRFASTLPELLREQVVARQEALRNKKAAADPEFAVALGSDPGPHEEAALLEVAAQKCAPIASRGDFSEDTWLNDLLEAVAAWARQDGEAPARLLAAAEWCCAKLAEDASRKLLLFSQSSDVVERMASLLEARDIGVRRFHRDLDDTVRQDAALEFAHQDAVRVLVSDELGGEGLNLQAAWAILHLDIPSSPNRIEQRIGRLDRIGRSPERPVTSFVMLGPCEGETLRHTLHRDVYKVYTESIGGLEFVLPRLQREMRAGVYGRESERRMLMSSLATEVEEARRQAEDSFQAAMDTSRSDLERANEVAEYLSNKQGDEQFAPARWLKALGVGLDGDGGYSKSRVSWNPVRLECLIPGVQTQDNFRATWSRSCALREERRQFLAPGHRLIDGAYLLLDQASIGRAAGIDRRLGVAGKGKLFALAVFVDALPAAAARVPAGLVTKARAVLGRDCNLVVLQWEGQEASWAIERDPTLLRQLEKDSEVGDVDWLDQKRRLMESNGILEALRLKLRSVAAELAANATERNGGAAEELEEAWADELSYLAAIAESEDASERRRGQLECALRVAVIDRVREVKPRLDALLFVRGV